jgi:hypothetical protein
MARDVPPDLRLPHLLFALRGGAIEGRAIALGGRRRPPGLARPLARLFLLPKCRRSGSARPGGRGAPELDEGFLWLVLGSCILERVLLGGTAIASSSWLWFVAEAEVPRCRRRRRCEREELHCRLPRVGGAALATHRLPIAARRVGAAADRADLRRPPSWRALAIPAGLAEFALRALLDLPGEVGTTGATRCPARAGGWRTDRRVDRRWIPDRLGFELLERSWRQVPRHRTWRRGSPSAAADAGAPRSRGPPGRDRRGACETGSPSPRARRTSRRDGRSVR